MADGCIGLALVAGPSLGESRSTRGSVLLILAALLSYGIAINIAAPLQS